MFVCLFVCLSACNKIGQNKPKLPKIIQKWPKISQNCQ